MLGLQQRVAAQDENAGSRLSLGKQQGLGLGFNTVKGGSDSAPRSFAGKVAATNAAAPRRALGNITNTGGAQKENEKPGSTAGQKPVARRALGDITNSTAAAPSSAQVPLPSKSTQPLSQSRTKQPQPSQSVDQPSKLLSGRSKAASQLDRPALDVHASIERPAGKLWAEQERDRKQREKEEINSRVQRLFAAMPPATALVGGKLSSRSSQELLLWASMLIGHRSAMRCALLSAGASVCKQ
jgi:hypothetical protein